VNRFKDLLRPQKTAAILGCGPAGLFAAHALVQRGWRVVIYSNKRRSEMFGAQYLHRAIPGLSDATTGRHIDYKLVGGTIDDYQGKVYGRRSGIRVSPGELAESHLGWDIRSAYNLAWELYSDHILNTPNITAGWAYSISQDNYNVVISTLPAPTLCGNEEHNFDSQSVWAVGDAPERGIFCPVTEAKPFQVICNASRDYGWYRNANVFGYRTAEWSMDRKPPIEGVAKVEKPLSTNCDCLPGIIRLGRYGEWRKGVLSHEAYEKALKL
jgi:hypothetical protein